MFSSLCFELENLKSLRCKLDQKLNPLQPILVILPILVHQLFLNIRSAVVITVEKGSIQVDNLVNNGSINIASCKSFNQDCNALFGFLELSLVRSSQWSRVQMGNDGCQTVLDGNIFGGEFKLIQVECGGYRCCFASSHLCGTGTRDSSIRIAVWKKEIFGVSALSKLQRRNEKQSMRSSYPVPTFPY